jgi:hypothetical protein
MTIRRAQIRAKPTLGGNYHFGVTTYDLNEAAGAADAPRAHKSAFGNTENILKAI